MQVSDTTQITDAPGTASRPAAHTLGANAWLLWIVATVAGFLVSSVLSIIVAALVPGVGGLALQPLVVAFGQAVLGVLQWLVMRRYIAGMRWRGWVLSTVVGQFIAGILTVAAVGSLIFTLGELGETLGGTATLLLIKVVSGAVHGAIFGFIQWLVLRRYIMGAGWWIPANIVAWALAGAVPMLEGLDFGLGAQAGSIVAKALSGATLGAITGIALVCLLQKPRRSA